MINTRLSRLLSISFLALCLGGLSVRAHTPAQEMSDAAQNFLAGLAPGQKDKATFEMKDPEREGWNFVPLARKGLPMKELSPAQRLLAHALLASALSQRGYIQATTIMSLEDILRELEQGRGPVRDPELYYVSIFGRPAAQQTWAWRLEGHHLSLNFVIVDGKEITVTPSFFGTNPGQVRGGARTGLRVISTEEDLGFELVRSLNARQRESAIYSNTAPREVITGNLRQVEALPPKGLSAGDMTSAQVKLVRQILQEYTRRYRPELAEGDLKRMEESGIKKLFFTWAGALEPGQGHYYRVQGPTFLLEFDNTQNDANHIHTVWRDLGRDFGRDLLRLHYQQMPHPESGGGAGAVNSGK